MDNPAYKFPIDKFYVALIERKLDSKSGNEYDL